MKKTKLSKIIIGMILAVSVGVAVYNLTGCNAFGPEVNRVTENISQKADNFNVTRRLTVINTRSHKPMFELVGNFSLKVDHNDNQLEVTCETGKDEYKKHFIGLNDETAYIVEDLCGASVDKYSYEVNFLPEAIKPFKLTNID